MTTLTTPTPAWQLDQTPARRRYAHITFKQPGEASLQPGPRRSMCGFVGLEGVKPGDLPLCPVCEELFQDGEEVVRQAKAAGVPIDEMVAEELRRRQSGA